MTRVAIIAAMPAELKPLVRGWQHELRNGVHLWRWRYEQGEWIAACAGAGVDAAARAFAEAEKDGPLSFAISTGWAGALSEEFLPGQAYRVSGVIDVRTGERFSTSLPAREVEALEGHGLSRAAKAPSTDTALAAEGRSGDKMAAPQGLNRLQKEGESQVKSLESIPQGLKPGVDSTAVTARLKSCPDTSCHGSGVFPQPVKPNGPGSSAIGTAPSGYPAVPFQNKHLLATSSRVADAPEKQRLASAYGAALVDMEAAGVARMAAMRGIPFYCWKGVSDGFSEKLPDFNRFISAGGQFLLARFVLFALVRPWYWPRLMRMGENSKKAAQGIAESLFDFLDERAYIRKRNGYPNQQR
jgi:nucleoside phosphorylase